MVTYLSHNAHPKPYVEHKNFLGRKKTYLIALCVLFVLTLVAWVITFYISAPKKHFSQCPQANKKLTVEPLATVLSSPPINPNLVHVRVLNATNTSGQAEHQLEQFKNLGFTPAHPSIGNDTIYKAGELTCPGQIRFGPRGKAAAATVRLAFPCGQFISDDRKSNTIDIVIGTQFSAITIPNESTNALTKLHEKLSESSRKDLGDHIQCSINYS